MSPEIDTNLRVIGYRYINTQLAKLSRHLECAKIAEDNEDIHQVRVACRRLRSAFVFFHDCFDDKMRKTAVKHITKLMRTLGTARDLDVQIEFLTEALSTVDSEHKSVRPGIRRIVLRWRQRRNAIQTKVLDAIHKIQDKHALTEIHLVIERLLFERQDGLQVTISSAVNNRIGLQLQRRVDDFLQDRHCVNQPDDHTGHHALRILAKKLRYEMEISDLILNGGLKDCIKQVKRIQTILGKMHDCVVWESDISDFIKQERQRTVEFYGNARPFSRILPGLEFLRRERRTHHNALWIEVSDYIAQLDQERFWDTLLAPFKTDTAPLQICTENDPVKKNRCGRPSPEGNSEA